MGTIALHDKKTKKLLTEFEIDDDVINLLKKLGIKNFNCLKQRKMSDLSSME